MSNGSKSGEGLNLIAAVCASGQPRALSRIDEEHLLNDERDVLRFVRGYLRRNNNVYPSLRAIKDETGVRVPPARDTVDYWIDRIRRRYVHSNMRPMFKELQGLLSALDTSPEDIGDMISQMQTLVRSSTETQDVFTIREGSEILLQEYERAKSTHGLAGIPTGWQELDEMSGGWMPADLNMLIARPSIGKTFHLLHSMLAADAAGYSTILCTMEMPVDQIMRRMAGMLAGIDPIYIKRGRLSTAAERRFLRALEDIEDNTNMLIVSGGLKKSVGQLDPIVGEHNPDAVFIDGVYLMMSDRSQRLIKRAERMESVVSEIKEHTMTRGKPYFCTSQFNRESGKGGRSGTLETVGYSDAVGTDSSLVLSLKAGVRLHGWQDTRVLQVMKGRDGETGGWLVNHTFSPPNFDIICPYIEDQEGEENGNNGNNSAQTQAQDTDFEWRPTITPNRPQ